MIEVVRSGIGSVRGIKDLYKNTDMIWGLVDGSQCVILGYSSDKCRIEMEVGETSNGKEWKGVLAARTGRAYSGIEYTRKMFLQKDHNRFRGNVNVYKFIRKI